MGEEGEERERRDFKKKYFFCIQLFDFQIQKKMKDVKRYLCGFTCLFQERDSESGLQHLQVARCSGSEHNFLSLKSLSANPSFTVL